MKKFCDYKKEETDKVVSDVIDLLPSNFTEVGQTVKPEKVKIYTQKLKIQSIDEVIDRPFMECLLLAFYFAQSSELENKIIELIQRCISQKKEVFNNLLRLELLFSKEHRELYSILNEIFIELKNIVAESQTWLTLENDDDYNFVRTEEFVLKIVKIFKNQHDQENLAIKQSIFKNIGGHLCLIELIDKGLNVIENSIKNQNQEQQQYQQQLQHDAWEEEELFERLVSILKNSFQVLSAYCLDNKENQEFMFNKFFKSLIKQKNLNIGQIEFIIDIFRDNYELSTNLKEQDLKYFIDMIKKHGKQHQFLEIFDVLLNNMEQKQDTYDLLKLLLSLFFDEKDFYSISPFAKRDPAAFLQIEFFFETKTDEQKYKSIFTILVSRLMSDEMEQSQIIKVSKLIPALELLKYLRERTVSYRQINTRDLSVIDQNVKVNAAIIDLILFLSNANDFTLNLTQITKFLVEIVEFETMKLERAQQTPYPETYRFYLIDNFLPLINYFSENYLKDLLFSENTTEIDQRKKLYKFAYTFINSLDKVLNFKQEELLENDRGRQLRVLSKYYDFQIPTNILGERNNLESIDDKFEQNQDNSYQPKMRIGSKKNTKANQFNDKILEEVTKVKKSKDGFAKNINLIEYWQHFKQKLSQDKQFRSILKSERNVLSKSILNISSMFQSPNKKAQRDIILNIDDILSKILQFIEFWRQKNVPIKNAIFVMKTLNNILIIADTRQEEEDNLMGAFKQNSQQGEKKEIEKIRQERQDLLDRLNSSKIVIMLIWDEIENNEEYLNSLLKFLNLMLLGGNASVQKTIYDYFISSQASEKFFSKMNRILENQNFRKNSQKMINKILRLFQLFCEGHNIDLQNYMRKQTNNKNSYDLVSITVKLLISYRVSKGTYKTIEQCFDTLTEFVQGPCLENQDTIASSKFLEYAFQILSEDEKLFVNNEMQQDERQKQQLYLLKNEQINDTPQIGNGNAQNNQNKSKIAELSLVDKTIRTKRDGAPSSTVPLLDKHGNPLGDNVRIYDNSVHAEIEPIVEKKFDKSKGQPGHGIESNMSQINQNTNIENQASYLENQKLTAEMNKEESIQQQERIRKERFQIHLGEVARLKYKCLLSIISILECNQTKKDLVSRIMRIIPVSILTQNLSRVYQLYLRHIKNQDYSSDLFNRMNLEKDKNKSADYYELIIENGFLIYMLIQLYISNNVLIETDDDDDMTSVLDEFKKQEQSSFVDMLQEKDNIFGNMMNFGRDLLSYGQKAISEIKENAYKIGGFATNKDDELEMLRKEKKQLMKDALVFFKNKTCSIEIVRDGTLQTISFPKLPLCFMLSDEMKDDFKNKVDRSSHKEKLQYLIDQSVKIIEMITHEENLRQVVDKYKFVGIFVKYNSLWERLSFYLAISINAIIIASYSDVMYKPKPGDNVDIKNNKYYDARLNEPRLFFDETNNNTYNLILLLGTISTIIFSVVVVFFILKRAPLIVGQLWYGFLNSAMSIWKKIIFFILKSIYSIYLLMQDFDIIYYLFQLFFVMLGLFFHPFFFAGLLTDILRFSILRNVVRAIYEPRVELGLCFLLFVIIEYYFTIFSYLFFFEQYLNGECTSFWKCLFKNFDYTFKDIGTLGHFLYEPESLREVGNNPNKYQGVDQDLKDKYFSRFFYDNIFSIVLILIVLNIVRGIIIDRYRELKDAQDEKQKDEKKNCFICGFDRQTLDKGDDILGFFYHIRQEHYMWNYIFYQAYLQFKDKTEYNGDESYISNKIEKNDISWIPKKKTKRIPDEQDIDEEKIKHLKFVKKDMKQLNEQMEKIILRQKYMIRSQKIYQQQSFQQREKQDEQQQQQQQQ